MIGGLFFNCGHMALKYGCAGSALVSKSSKIRSSFWMTALLAGAAGATALPPVLGPGNFLGSGFPSELYET